MSAFQQIRVIDSHTGGEPTRVVVSGGPALGSGSMADRLERFRSEHDHFRSAIVNEPRASEATVGALLLEPSDPSFAAGVIFFNNVGYLGMCGHGTIGLGVTLAHMGKIQPGAHKIETPVGVVSMQLHSPNEVSFENVRSYRWRKNVAVNVAGFGEVRGDVAWGGNWFFLTYDTPCQVESENLEQLTAHSCAIREALQQARVTGEHGREIDHIEIFGNADSALADGRSFVLCPGKAYDRSPCGTGTSAKMACLYADGKLKPGDVWRQESVIGSLFEGHICVREEHVYPQIKGSAYITAEATLVLSDDDPFRWGIRR